MNEEEIVKGLRWMAKVRTVCEDSICECHKCEFHGFCTDPDEGESLVKQSDWLTESASLIEFLQAQLAESQRRADAAVEDMKVMALAMRESDELSEGCCFACVCDGQNLPGNVILPYGECPGYDTNDCFEWRGPQDEKGE